MWKNIIYNSIAVNLPKNIVQYLLGVVLFIITFGFPNPLAVIIPLLAFVFAYSSVYLYNDVTDAEEDAKDPEKIRWKIVASGLISKKQATSLYIVFAAIGIAMSLFINRWFFLMVIALIVLNFLHSAPSIRLKERRTASMVNMTVIQFIKYSCGWFALTTNVSRFPALIILLFAIFYTLSYKVYKVKFNVEFLLENKPIIFMAVIAALLYIVSLLTYEYVISIIVITFFVAAMLSVKNTWWRTSERNKMLILDLIVLPVMLLSFLMLTNPAIAEINEQVSCYISEYRSNISAVIPDDVEKSISTLMHKYKSLEDFECEIREVLNRAFAMR